MTQSQALTILKTGANVFLTGEPGSGKTHTINQYVTYLHSHDIDPAITASTGIAATHIGGMTIHSWSGVGIKNKLSKSDLHKIVTNEYVEKRISKTKILIIDEVSMLPPEVLSMVDAVCRGVKKNPNPFGGMQVVLVGDFFQLPPVIKKENNIQIVLPEYIPARFAYDSPAWSMADFITCYITEQYRQDDLALVSILSKIRSNSFGAESMAIIEKRKIDIRNAPEYAPKLFSHNLDVDLVNNQMLVKLPSQPRLFAMSAKGHEALVNVMKKGCLSPESLYLKVGANVMFTKNNSKEGFVNGTLGVVEGFSKNTGLPIIKIRNGRKIETGPMDWTIEENGKVRARLTQIPLRLAWAITVHKSQGISLDEAVMDLSNVFEFGQGYVALSRVRRLIGIHILGWNDLSFQVSPEVLEKDKLFCADSQEAENIFSKIPRDEIEKRQEDFIITCNGVINISDAIFDKKKKKPNTHLETLKLWNEGKGISQIAEIRVLKEKTIFAHIEDLFEKGKIKREDLPRLVTSDLSRALPKIHTAFYELDTDRLSPVFEKFDGKYSYDELRLARMMIEKK